MRTKPLMFLLILLLSWCAQGQMIEQTQVSGQIPDSGGGPKKNVVFYHAEMGRWWQDSAVAQKLQLTDNQISQLNQIFTQHRLNLNGDLQEEQKANQALEALLATENPDDDQVNTQVDQVLSARNKLQREFTTMNVDFRKVLTLDQWKQLKAINQERAKAMLKKMPPPLPGGPGGKTVIIQPGDPATGPGPIPFPAIPD